MRPACIIAVVAVLGLAPPTPSLADHTIVLVTSGDSSFSNLSIQEIRKLYLGFSVAKSGHPIHAVTNRSDERLWDVFLQNVIGMSDRSYSRRLLTLTLQSGRRRPAVFDDLEQLLSYVESNPNSIAFVWLEDAEEHEKLRTVRILWQH